MPVAAVLDECRLQRRFYASDFCELNISLKRTLISNFGVVVDDPVPIHDHDTSFFVVRGVY